MSLLENDVPVRNVVTTGPEKAKALEHDARAKILDMLADNEMTVQAIHEELTRRGEEMAETTVRHHVNVLRDAGMVEVARLEEAGGGTRKHYKSNTRVYSYTLPDDAEQRLANASADFRDDLVEVIDSLFEEHGDAIEEVAREMKPCSYCETQRYEEFVVRELIDRALTELSEDQETEPR